MKYYKDTNLRALLITLLLTALILIWFKPETEFSIAIMCIVIATFFGLIASLGSDDKKHHCQLVKVLSANKLQIRFNQKKFTTPIWGISTEHDHPHNDIATQALIEWLENKNLSFTDTHQHNDKEYWAFQANGQDVGLWLLENSHAKLTTSYLSNPRYENANTTAKYLKQGIHKKIENKPWHGHSTNDETLEVA